MAKYYSFKDYISDMGLDMSDFKRLDNKTQEKWIAKHQKKINEISKERDELHDIFMFQCMFLKTKEVTVEEFEKLTEKKKSELKKQYENWKNNSGSLLSWI